MAWSCSLRCAAPSNADCELAPGAEACSPGSPTVKDSPRAADVKKEAQQLEGLDHRHQLAQTCQCMGRCLKDETGKGYEEGNNTSVHVTLMLRESTPREVPWC